MHTDNNLAEMQTNCVMLITFGQNKRNIEIFKQGRSVEPETKKLSSRRMKLNPVKSVVLFKKPYIYCPSSKTPIVLT